MPIAGLLTRPRQWNAIEFRCESNATYSIVGAVPGGGDAITTASLQTGFIPNTLNVLPGITLQVSAGKASGIWNVSYNGPNEPFGGYTASGPVGSGGWVLSISAILRNLKIYALDPAIKSTYRMTLDDIELWINGGLAANLGGLSADGAGLSPCHLPLFGLPPIMSGTGGVTGGTDVGNYNWTASLDHMVKGGFRIDRGDGWEDYNMTLPDIKNAPLGGAPFGITPAGIIVSDTTWGDHVHVVCEGDAARAGCPVPPGSALAPASAGFITRNGWVMTLPDIGRSVKRIDPETYGALWLRHGTPEAKSEGRRQYYVGTFVPNPTNIVTEVETVEHESTTQMLARVDENPHVIEDPLNWPAYAPMSAQIQKQTAYNPSSPCNDSAVAYTDMENESATFTFPSEVEDNPQAAGYLFHAEELVRYLHGIPNAHWSYAYARFDWLLEGGATPFEDYWRRIRSQHLFHGALPPEEQTAERNHIISCPLEESQHTPFLDVFYGAGTGRARDGLDWLGVSRFDVRTFENLPFIKYDERSQNLYGSEGGLFWTDGENCTIDVDATGVELTPDPGAEMIAFRINVADWDHYPYLAAAWCDRLYAAWSSSNVEAARILVEGNDGERVLLELNPGDGFTTNNTEYPLPRGPQSKYAGDWKQDHGDGIIADEGSDLQPSGISAATMANPERATLFELLHGLTPRRIRYEFDITSDASPVILPHPELRTSEHIAKLYWTTGAHGAWLLENGPGPRYSNLDWYEIGIGTLFHPVVQPRGYKTTIIDALRYGRMIVEGKFYSDGEAAELADLYDPQEGQSVGAVDRWTIAWPIKPTEARKIPFALVNTLREIPPHCMIPIPARDPDTLEFDGEPTMETWSWAQHLTRLISAGSKADMHKPDGTKVTTNMVDVPAGWFGTEHATPVDGSEGLDWRVRTGEQQWAAARPWHGYYALLEEILASGGQVHLTRMPLGQICAVFARSSGLTSWVFDAKGTSYEATVVEVEGITCAQVAWSEEGYLVAVYCASGTTFRVDSHSAGKRWGDPVPMMGGSQVAIATHPETGVEIIVTWASGDYTAYRRMSKGATLETLGVITSGDEARAGLEYAGDELNRLVFVLDGVERYESTNDGNTWVEIS